MAFLLNYRWQKGDMAEIAKRPKSDGVTEWVCDIYVIRESWASKKLQSNV